MENDCLLADIILPSNTKFEIEDIGADNQSGQFSIVYHESQCIVPIGESLSDYEIVCRIAKRLSLLEEYTSSMTIQDWIRYGFETSGINENITYEDFKKMVYVVPNDPEWKKYPIGWRAFYERS